MNFHQLGLNSKILQAIEQLGYGRSNLIQQKAIPPVIAGRDLVGSAQTGTGKTAAFALPCLIVSVNTENVALALAPTRELAIQIEENFKLYGQCSNLRIALLLRWR